MGEAQVSLSYFVAFSAEPITGGGPPGGHTSQPIGCEVRRWKRETISILKVQDMRAAGILITRAWHSGWPPVPEISVSHVTAVR